MSRAVSVLFKIYWTTEEMFLNERVRVQYHSFEFQQDDELAVLLTIGHKTIVLLSYLTSVLFIFNFEDDETNVSLEETIDAPSSAAPCGRFFFSQNGTKVSQMVNIRIRCLTSFSFLRRSAFVSHRKHCILHRGLVRF